MRNRFLTLAFLLVFVALPGTVMAAEPVPGGACSAANLIVETGGPETGGIRNLMKCNGTTWQQLTTWLANGYVGFQTTSPAAPLQVNGEAIIGPTTGLACSSTISGGLRYNSASACMQFCNGTSWNCISSTSCDNAPAYFISPTRTVLEHHLCILRISCRSPVWMRDVGQLSVFQGRGRRNTGCVRMQPVRQ